MRLSALLLLAGTLVQFHPFCDRITCRTTDYTTDWLSTITGLSKLNQVPFLPDPLAAASTWVTGYRKDVAFLLADETYTQTRLDADGRVLGTRTMQGELFLTYLEADEAWIAVHDVATVDGVPVPDRESLVSMIQQGGELRGIARRVAERNAQFNIGAVSRNFNEPTLALMLLEPARVMRLRVDQTRVDRSPARTLVTLAYEERGRPTLVRGPSGPIASRGEFVVEPDSGRVRRARFTLRQDDLRADLETTFALDERLDVWVPTLFTERYEVERDGTAETIACEARYTNFRRFIVLSRIR